MKSLYQTNNKVVGLSKFKAFADDKIYMRENLQFVFGSMEIIVGKGENAGNQHFLHTHSVLKGYFFRVVKSRDCVV